MVIRSFSFILTFVLVFNLFFIPRSEATIASGTLTDRGVFSLTAQGAARLGLAEVQIAQAVRLMGALGQVGAALSVGFVVYEVSSGLWDWWNSSYDPVAASNMGPAGSGNFGIQSGYGIGQCHYGQRWVNGVTGAVSYIDLSANCPSNMLIVGRMSYMQYSGDNSIEILHHNFMSLPVGYGILGHTLNALPDREGFIESAEAAKAALQFMTAENLAKLAAEAGQPYAFSNDGLAGAVALIDDAIGIVSGGVELQPGDVIINDAGASVGTKPGELTGAPPAEGDLAGVISAVSGMSAAVVSAVNAVAAAVAASAVAIYTPIVAAVAASQAAVVSAVQAIAAPIVTAINEAKTAIVSAVSSAPAGDGSSAGTTAAVNDLAAADAARNQAATDAAAAAAPAEVICPVCVREDKWADAWGMLSAAGQAAPVFGLINRIVINPVGTLERVRTVNTANFGALTFNLNQWGIDTYIGVIRYVVIFVALIAGYFVIFG